MRLTVLLTLILVFAGFAVQARPISYPGGWMLMTTNDVDANALEMVYSPSARYSVGWMHEYLRDAGAHTDLAEFNFLLKRWNQPDAQANLYFKTGAGIAYNSDETAPAGFIGMAADWENRRLLVSYENHFMDAGDVDSMAKHKARVGVAPYIGDYGDLHTWLMLEADYDAGNKDSFSLTPLVRLFKGTNLVEAGYNLDGGVLFNFTKTF